MSNSLHQLYRSKAIVLAKTMVVKFNEVALAINEHLKSLGYAVDDNDPTTWKYYLNLFGEYHQYDHDLLLQLSNGRYDHVRIKVAGENEPVEVDFTKEFLFGENADIAVANEYRYSDEYYNALVEQYPEFREIINGVLNPIPIEISTSAKDGEILYCGGYLKTKLPSGRYHFVRQVYGPISENFLIENNEENLLLLLQEQMTRFLERWDNVNYHLTADLFYPLLLGILFANVPNMVENIRVFNVKSPRGFTHSFYIREYLESFGRLGWIVEHVSKATSLWIYRNLMWLDANRGKDMVFQSIITNVLNRENIPLSGFRLRHDTTEIGEEGVLTPTPFLEREVINFKHIGDSVDYRTVREMIDAEHTLATENYYDKEGQSQKTSNVSKFSMFDNVDTKVLESTVIDMSSQQAFTLEDFAMNLWGFAASYGFYRGTVIATNPITTERVQLTPLNAYILAIYCLNRGWADWEMETIPTMYARRIPRARSWSPNSTFDFKPLLEDMEWGTKYPYIEKDKIVEIMGDFEPKFNFNSADSFNKELLRVHSEAMRQYYAFVKIEDRNGRAYGEHVSHYQWWYEVPCKLVKKPTKYVDWIRIQGIEIEEFTRKDFVSLGLALVEAATGIDLDRGGKLRNKQAAVLAVLKHFASYTIQIIQNTVSVDSFLTGGKTLRLSNLKASLSSEERVKLLYLTAKSHWSVEDKRIWLSSMNLTGKMKVKETIEGLIKIDNVNVVFGKQKHSQHMRIRLTTIGLNNIEFDNTTKPCGDIFYTEKGEMITSETINEALVPEPEKDCHVIVPSQWHINF